MDDHSIGVFEGCRVQHWDVLGPFKGGLRYHPNVTLEEVTALADVDDVEMRSGGLPMAVQKGNNVRPKEKSVGGAGEANAKIRQSGL